MTLYSILGDIEDIEDIEEVVYYSSLQKPFVFEDILRIMGPRMSDLLYLRIVNSKSYFTLLFL